jgi:hypothetical protein
MESRKILMRKILIPLSIIVFAVILRLLPHPPNMAPIAAMALFGGFYLDKKYALIIPLVALLLSDLFLGFYSEMPFIYGSFILTGLIGLWLKKQNSKKYIVAGALFSSILFFLITNFGVWLMGSMYAKNLSGFLECYTLAIPFFRNTLIGDLLYTGLFFGSFELAKILLSKTERQVIKL